MARSPRTPAEPEGLQTRRRQHQPPDHGRGVLGRSLHALWAEQVQAASGAGGPAQAPVWDVVIVGTGYGGSMAAAALAGCTVSDGQGRQRPLRLCILERGREMRPGEFPSRLAELPAHLRIGQQGSGELGGQAEGLFDVRVGSDVMALVANGVGGGSLINAGVLLEPEPSDLRRADFASLVTTLRNDGWFDGAREALGGAVGSPQSGGREPGPPQPNTIERHPAHQQRPLAKSRALGLLAAGAGAGADRQGPVSVPITVALQRGPNAAGVELPACTLCGDCMTGCNVGAKDSLDVNLLRLAVDAGAQLFTGASVSRLLPVAKGTAAAEHSPDPQNLAATARWVLEVEHTQPTLQAREAAPLRLQARHVILAAGTLGSTEILLRSRSGELTFSQRLGERFSCNGDNIAAVHRLPEATEGSADEATALHRRRVGPTITSALPFPEDPGRGGRPFWLQEFSVPGAMRRLFEEIVTTGHALHQLPEADRRDHGPGEDPATDPAAVDRDAMDRTLLVGLIGHDDAKGVLTLPRAGASALGTLRIHWPEARHATALEAASAAVEGRVRNLRLQAQQRASKQGQPAADGPHWVPNPMWRMLPEALSALVDGERGPVLTVHPLGGCAMGLDASQGVVDDVGRVFDGQDASGTAFLPGLAVLDGAIVPESLGANPSLTIAALALRAAHALRMHWGLEPGVTAVTAEGQDSHACRRRLLAPPIPRPRPMASPRTPLPGQVPVRPTRIAVTERLTGPVMLDLGDQPGGARPWIVEWTLEYRPASLEGLSASLSRSLTVDEGSPHTRVRLYDAQTWEARGLAGQSDEWRHPHALVQACVSGHLRFLHREPSTQGERAWKSFLAWARHRGLRDLYQLAVEHRVGLRRLARAIGLKPPEPVPQPSLRQIIRGILDTTTRAGEVRRFDYHLVVGQVHSTLRGADGQPVQPFQPGDVLQGHKRLTYRDHGNPWRQLTELQVTRMPGMSAGRAGMNSEPGPVGATLVLDPRFLASRQTPLLRIVDQQDQVQALADLASFGLTLLRLMASVHLWTFRKPDTQPQQEPVRLPLPIAGLPPPQVTEWEVAAAREGRPPARVRLTRYPQTRRPHGTGQSLPALVLIHGYSVSGNTFTHPSLRPSAAEWFHRQGRDVWVLDLRTSSAMPTATVPWTLEEVALVDLPAALVHVRQATGAQVDVLAHCIGCVMLSMALLSRPDELQARAQALNRNLPLDAAQLALLDTFNGPQMRRPDGACAPSHPTLRRLVLSQKGPVLRYTDANVLRGWVMQYARRWLLPDGFQFRPSAQPGLAEQILDRLLASMPYPDADWRVENPIWPWARTAWTATRHRMDALYGRDFEAAGLRPQTLEAIDDLFGPIHLDTVAQTIHFTQADQATDHTGLGDYVTPGRLRERWAGIQTLALHGRDNGLADVFTQRLLGLHLGTAGVPFAARTFDHMGHQDLLIGRHAAAVFEEVERFLRHGVESFGSPPAPVQASRLNVPGHGAAQLPVLAVQAPWLGPRLDVLAGRVRVAAMPPLDAGAARLVLVPVRRSAQGWRLCAGRFGLSRRAGHSRQWQFAWGDRLLQPSAARQRPGAPDSQPTGWLALMVYHPEERAALPMDLPWPSLNGTTPAQAQAPMLQVPSRPGRIRQARRSIRQWLQRAPEALLETCLLPREAVQRLVRHLPGAARDEAPGRPGAGNPGPGTRVRLALASCQYPHGPLDREPAQASLQRMADWADRGALDLALFLGDQIYADATAGLVDPTRRDERYEAPHEHAQRAPGLRRVLARLPSVMLVDDHELVDNWEPPGAMADAANATASSKPLWHLRAEALRDGRWAYWKYERLRPQDRDSPDRELADKAFSFAGLPLYLADTRTGRSARSASTPARAASILAAPGQFEALERWLWRHRHQPKVVATPSMLLPRRAEVARDAAAAGRSDAWDGYPASLDRLLDFIARKQIRHTVFVSGDEHHALVCEVTLTPAHRRGRPLQPVRLLSVHSSALYAPFPFANGHPADLSDAGFTTAGGTDVLLKTTAAPPGPGWAQLSLPARLAPGAQGLNVSVRHVQCGGDSTLRWFSL